jgi:hypothetical protein
MMMWMMKRLRKRPSISRKSRLKSRIRRICSSSTLTSITS